MTTTAYVELTEANNYFAERLNSDVWDDSDDADKNIALKHATRIINKLNFRGTKTVSTQENQFPRDTDITIPQDIQYATCEIAIALLDGVDPDLEFENLSLVNLTMGNVRSQYDRTIIQEHFLSGVPSATAWRYLKPYLRDPLEIDFKRV